SKSGDKYNTNHITINEWPLTTGIAGNNSTKINLSIYPNPVLESTTVSYQLAENAIVSARLISLTGQTITTFFNEFQSSGVQERKLMIDPSVAKGIYLVALDVNEN